MSAIRLSDIQNQRDTILAIAQRHGAANVRVFGSVVRGEARDVDVVTEPMLDADIRADVLREAVAL
jgi:predicted nucleotidyltransferase